MHGGANAFGQVGDNSKTNKMYSRKITGISRKAISIGCGDFYSFALTDKNELFGWGGNHDGQLRYPYCEDVCTPNFLDNTDPLILGGIFGKGEERWEFRSLTLYYGKYYPLR